MSIIFSRRCELGIQATLYLSTLNTQEWVRVGEIAEKLQIPKEFIAKILQELCSPGIIESRKGRQGGFRLRRPSNRITLYDILVALDGDSIFKSCVLGFPSCSSEHTCPVHDMWSKVNQETARMLTDETIDQFKGKITDKVMSLQLNKPVIGNELINK